MFDEHRERLRQLQALLVAHLQQATQQLAHDRQIVADREADCHRRSTELEVRQRAVEALEQAHLQQRETWEQRIAANDERLEVMLLQLRTQLEDIQQKRTRLTLEEGRLRQSEQDHDQRHGRESRNSSAPSSSAHGSSSASSESKAGGGSASGGLNWESMKKQLLAELELEGQSASDATVDPQRLDEWMRQTDEIVAEKDRQIVELQDLLHSQSANIGQFAVGAAAVADLLDQDSLIREERESLRQMQEEWHEKLRRAELEISMERAKIARERVELEEKVRRLESERAAMAPVNEDPNNANKSKSPQRGRWMARLGLSGEE